MSGNGSRFDRSIADRASALEMASLFAKAATDLVQKSDSGKLLPAIQALSTLSLAWSQIASMDDSVIWSEHYAQLEDNKNLTADWDRLAADTKRVFGAGGDA